MQIYGFACSRGIPAMGKPTPRALPRDCSGGSPGRFRFGLPPRRMVTNWREPARSISRSFSFITRAAKWGSHPLWRQRYDDPAPEPTRCRHQPQQPRAQLCTVNQGHLAPRPSPLQRSLAIWGKGARTRTHAHAKLKSTADLYWALRRYAEAEPLQAQPGDPRKGAARRRHQEFVLCTLKRVAIKAETGLSGPAKQARNHAISGRSRDRRTKSTSRSTATRARVSAPAAREDRMIDVTPDEEELFQRCSFIPRLQPQRILW